jgi:hypothetical protein
VVPANLLNVPSPNVFQEQCFDAKNPDNTLEPCSTTVDPTELTFAEDDQGGIHIPFDYTKIRIPKNGADPITRIIAGLSAAGRKQKGKDPAIYLPGREFLGTTPVPDPEGTSSDWRKPDIAPWRPADRPNEVGLIGTVEEDNSIVHIFPRLKVGWLCDSPDAENEACLAVERFASGGVEKCAEQDRWSAVCKTIMKPRFMACQGGPLDGMPCTRPAHCGPNGYCNGVPACQSEGDVWEPGKVKGSDPCNDDGDCKANEQCGYSLFNLHDRTDNLVYKVEKGAGKKERRGVCSNDRKEVCSSSPGGHSCASGNICEGYFLEAKGKK